MNAAVEAMGGDHSPEIVVQGAVGAVSEFGKALIPGPPHGHISFHYCEDKAGSPFLL